MKIENPFESGHIKNYILAYASVVVIMVLFFIAASLFHTPKQYPKKEFKKGVTPTQHHQPQEEQKQESAKSSSVKLLQKGYE